MPDHIHLLVGWQRVPPKYQGSLGDLVSQIKAMTTRAARFDGHLKSWESIWAPGFWDRVVRNDRERDAIRRYIEENPSRAWQRVCQNPNSLSR
jgi:REP element-mobilizing transposase RayT